MKPNDDLLMLNSLTGGMMRGIERLLDAYKYACLVQRDHWEFAVEIQSLHDAGMNNAELRWLVCKGLVQHALEDREEVVARSRRAFRKVGDLILLNRSCFVLTKTGFEAYKDLVSEEVTPAPA